jgi:hypothetical protein
MNDFFPLLIAILFVVVAFVSAERNGVVKLLCSGAAAAAALAVFFILVHLLPSLADRLMDIQLTWEPVIGIASLSALVVYVISRFIFSFVFKRVFNSDGLFGDFVDGVPGGIISLFPSAVVVFFIFCCVRIAGTIQELNYTASLSQAGIIQKGGNIPNYPFSSSWRNGIESVPLAAPILDLIDPFSNRRNRNTAAMVLAKDSTNLRGFAENQKETANLIMDSNIDALSEVPDVYAALTKQDRMGLVLNTELRGVASSPELRDDLTRMDLRRVLEEFVKSLEPEPDRIPKN